MQSFAVVPMEIKGGVVKTLDQRAQVFRKLETAKEVAEDQTQNAGSGLVYVVCPIQVIYYNRADSPNDVQDAFSRTIFQANGKAV